MADSRTHEELSEVDLLEFLDKEPVDERNYGTAITHALPQLEEQLATMRKFFTKIEAARQQYYDTLLSSCQHEKEKLHKYLEKSPMIKDTLKQKVPNKYKELGVLGHANTLWRETFACLDSLMVVGAFQPPKFDHGSDSLIKRKKDALEEFKRLEASRNKDIKNRLEEIQKQHKVCNEGIDFLFPTRKRKMSMADMYRQKVQARKLRAELIEQHPEFTKEEIENLVETQAKNVNWNKASRKRVYDQLMKYKRMLSDYDEIATRFENQEKTQAMYQAQSLHEDYVRETRMTLFDASANISKQLVHTNKELERINKSVNNITVKGNTDEIITRFQKLYGVPRKTASFKYDLRVQPEELIVPGDLEDSELAKLQKEHDSKRNKEITKERKDKPDHKNLALGKQGSLDHLSEAGASKLFQSHLGLTPKGKEKEPESPKASPKAGQGEDSRNLYDFFDVLDQLDQDIIEGKKKIDIQDAEPEKSQLIINPKYQDADPFAITLTVAGFEEESQTISLSDLDWPSSDALPPPDVLLKRILTNAQPQFFFTCFLERCLCEENLNFWLDVNQYIRISSENPEKAYPTALMLHSHYVEPNAPQKINIPGKFADEITETLVNFNPEEDELDPEIFAAAQIEVFSLLKTDSLPKFVESKEYKEFLQWIDEMIEHWKVETGIDPQRYFF